MGLIPARDSENLYFPSRLCKSYLIIKYYFLLNIFICYSTELTKKFIRVAHISLLGPMKGR